MIPAVKDRWNANERLIQRVSRECPTESRAGEFRFNCSSLIATRRNSIRSLTNAALVRTKYRCVISKETISVRARLANATSCIYSSPAKGPCSFRNHMLSDQLDTVHVLHCVVFGISSCSKVMANLRSNITCIKGTTIILALDVSFLVLIERLKNHASSKVWISFPKVFQPL